MRAVAPRLPASKFANVPDRPIVHRCAQPQTICRSRPQIEAERQQELRIKHKIDQACRALADLEQREKDLAQRIRELQTRKARTSARIDRIETRMLEEMIRAGFDHAAGMHHTLKTNDGPDAVEISDEKLVPAEYLRSIPASTAPDKVKIKAALQADHDLEIPGCSLTKKVLLKIK